jgi:hypothetical protein
MRVVMIARFDCEGGNCPASYLTDRRSVLVQGWRTQAAPGGLARVTVPETLRRDHELAGGPAWPDQAYTGLGTGTLTVTGAAVTDPEALARISLADDEDVLELTVEEAA